MWSPQKRTIWNQILLKVDINYKDLTPLQNQSVTYRVSQKKRGLKNTNNMVLHNKVL